MDALTAALRVVLSDTFLMYFKSHSYHWNVEGIHFSQYHDFFGDLYDDLYGAVDPLAENLRKLDAYAPISLMELYNFKTITEDTAKPESVRIMLGNLLNANTTLLEHLSHTFDLATAAKEQGIANFIADRMDQHRKHEWQIKSSLKNLGEV
jgi:starvation-inducible DNA-binding protein